PIWRFQPQGLPHLLLHVVEPDGVHGDPAAEDPPAGDERGRRRGVGRRPASRRGYSFGFFRRTASTSHGAPCSTSLAVEPNSSARPWRPWLPTTIRSQPVSSARRCSSWRGWP